MGNPISYHVLYHPMKRNDDYNIMRFKFKFLQATWLIYDVTIDIFNTSVKRPEPRTT